MNIFSDFLECVEACFESSNYQYYKDQNSLNLQGHHSHWRIHILLYHQHIKMGLNSLTNQACG